MRLVFIKRERQELYTQLLFSAGLEEYLIGINNRTKEHILELTQKISHKQNIDEELKTRDQMAWVCRNERYQITGGGDCLIGDRLLVAANKQILKSQN